MVGQRIAEQRRSQGFTLHQLAAKAGVGRSTLAALETGKLAELGYAKVARICEALGLVLEARPPLLAAPLMAHRHLTETAGRELTKAAIEDVLVRGNIAAWRGLVSAIRADQTGRLARRVRAVAAGAGKFDPKVQAFVALMPDILHSAKSTATANG